MKRLIYIVGIAALGAGMFIADPPKLPAQQQGARQEMVVASNEPAAQSAIVRLAEASMVMRRGHDAAALGKTIPEPSPQQLFGSDR